MKTLKIKINCATTSRVVDSLAIALGWGPYNGKNTKFMGKWYHQVANMRTTTIKKLAERMIMHIESGSGKGDLEQLKTAKYADGIECFTIT